MPGCPVPKNATQTTGLQHVDAANLCSFYYLSASAQQPALKSDRNACARVRESAREICGASFFLFEGDVTLAPAGGLRTPLAWPRPPGAPDALCALLVSRRRTHRSRCVGGRERGRACRRPTAPAPPNSGAPALPRPDRRDRGLASASALDRCAGPHRTCARGSRRACLRASARAPQPKNRGR